jgi:hypothetical protein
MNRHIQIHQNDKHNSTFEMMEMRGHCPISLRPRPPAVNPLVVSVQNIKMNILICIDQDDISGVVRPVVHFVIIPLPGSSTSQIHSRPLPHTTHRIAMRNRKAGQQD